MQAVLPEVKTLIDEFSSLLSTEEMVRAERFRFLEHRQRFILSRGILRQILSQYLHQPAESISFTIGEQGKPYLQDNPISLQFNLSHSADIAVYAFTLGNEIGVDIEKVDSEVNFAVADRFFSESENQQIIHI